MRQYSDRQLILNMQRGDRVAMEHFFHRYSPYLYAVCLRYMPEAEIAKDLLHDAFVKIFTSIKSFRIDPHQDDAALCKSIKSWTARITAHLALNHLRRTHLMMVPLDDALCDEIPDEEIDPELLSADTLNSLIEDLPPNYRTVFNLFAVEGFSHREISKMLGISEALSATQYHRAKATLKIKIKKYLDIH